MKSYSFIFLALILISSCKKSSDSYTMPPGNPNHELKAMISINGGAFSTFTATANSTSFLRNIGPNGDVDILVNGNFSQSNINFRLVNVTPGVYPIGGVGILIPPFVTGSFSLGSYSMSNNSIVQIFTPTAVPGTITIEELTSTSIRGSFSMTCTGITGSVEITNGTFKGTF